MRLDPFGRTQQARLLAIPARVNEGACGLPALLDQGTDGLGLGQHRDRAREWIPRPEHPAIVMIAAHDPLIRILVTAHHRDHVVNRLACPLRLNL